MADLAEFIARYKDGPQQRTQEWLDVRRYGIGGSQIATLMGKNPYSGIMELLADKTNMTTFGFKLITYWGNIFEPLIRQYAERLYNTQVVGDQIFIKNDNSALYYSPDGFGALQCEISPEIAQYLTDEELSKTHYNVLFEFKCPFNRLPKHAGPPEYYIPQAQLGLKMAPICARCLFLEGVFRKCSIADFNFDGKYDKSLKQLCRWRAPVAIGWILFYGPGNGGQIVDIGGNYEEFENVFREHYNGNLHSEYSAIYYADDALMADPNLELSAAITALRADNRTVYVMPWKLFYVEEHSITPLRDYFDGIEPKVDSLIKSIKAINDADEKRKRETLGIEVGKWYTNYSQ